MNSRSVLRYHIRAIVSFQFKRSPTTSDDKNDHISSGSLARRCQARLTRTRPFLPAAAAAQDKLGASTPEVGVGEAGSGVRVGLT